MTAISLTLRPSTQFATIYERGTDRPLGTVQRRRVYSAGPVWKAYDLKGELICCAALGIELRRALREHFAPRMLRRKQPGTDVIERVAALIKPALKPRLMADARRVAYRLVNAAEDTGGELMLELPASDTWSGQPYAYFVDTREG